MDKLVMGSRLILGFIMFIFGLNGFLQIFFQAGFIPIPPAEGAFATFMAGLFTAKYLMPTVKILEIICGVMLLSNQRVFLALLLLAPIIYNIFLSHAFLAPKGLAMGAVCFILWLIVAGSKKEQFKYIFKTH